MQVVGAVVVFGGGGGVGGGGWGRSVKKNMAVTGKET